MENGRFLPIENESEVDNLVLDDIENETFRILKKDQKFQTLNIYLSEVIESNFKYVELLDTLRSASEQDDVKLFLANYGGSVSSGFQIINAIKECKAEVKVYVDAPCYSMGAILALSGTSLTMNPGTFLMFHNYSTAEFGKGAEVLNAINHYYEYFHKYLRVLSFPFLTDKELTTLKDDKDLYISYDDPDLKKRIKRHFK